jgi:hypothetical protein
MIIRDNNIKMEHRELFCSDMKWLGIMSSEDCREPFDNTEFNWNEEELRYQLFMKSLFKGDGKYGELQAVCVLAYYMKLRYTGFVSNSGKI